MNFARAALVGASSLVIASCGGGGSSTPPPTGGPAPTPSGPATLNSTLTASSIDMDLDEGEQQQFQFGVDVAGTTTDTVVADVTVDGRRISLESISGSGARYEVALTTNEFAAGGDTTSNVRFRLCTTSNCSTVYPGSTVNFTVNLDIELDDWKTFQRNERHNGYVAVAYDTADFAEAWSVDTGAQSPTEVAATDGSVFYNIQSGSSRYLSRAIDSASGTQQWQVDLGAGRFYLGAPSYNDGRVASASMDTSSFDLPIQILDANTGSVQNTIVYASQFSRPATLVPVGTDLFLQSGYFGNVVFSWDVDTATRQWNVEPNGPGGNGFIMEGQSVAVDDDYVYYYGVSNLYVLNRTTGQTVSAIPDPFFSMAGTSYFGTYYASPIITNAGDIIAFSGNRGLNQALPLNFYDMQSGGAGTYDGRTGNAYTGQPALRANLLFATRANTAIIDVIDTSSKAVVASIDASGSVPAEFTSNVIVTERHLFVGNANQTVAIDLTLPTPAVVWDVPRGGNLAITPDNHLIISATGGIHAYRLF